MGATTTSLANGSLLLNSIKVIGWLAMLVLIAIFVYIIFLLKLFHQACRDHAGRLHFPWSVLEPYQPDQCGIIWSICEAPIGFYISKGVYPTYHILTVFTIWYIIYQKGGTHIIYIITYHNKNITYHKRIILISQLNEKYF